MANDRNDLCETIVKNIHDVADVDPHANRLGVLPHDVRNAVKELQLFVLEPGNLAHAIVGASDLPIQGMVVGELSRPSKLSDLS